MNKLKIFATAILAAGATVAATNATATVSTNTQVLENITVALKFESQGALASTDKALAATATTFTTSDLIQQLVPFCKDVSGFAFSRSQKLVESIIYSNFLVGTPNTTITNLTNTITLGPGTNLVTEIITGTNALTFGQYVTATNGYLITNGILYELPINGAGAFTASNEVDPLTNDIIGIGAANAPGSDTLELTFNTNRISPATGSTHLGYSVLIVPSFSASATNISILETSPATNLLFTNAQDNICIYTPKSGSTAASLVEVDNWVGSFTYNDGYGEQKFAVYKEAGLDLSGGDFAGTNIASQTIVSYEGFELFLAYPTNSAPSGQTNIIFDDEFSDTYLSGPATETTKLINLTVSGTAAEKAEFQVIGTKTTPVSGAGYIGGTYSTNELQTNTFNGVTTTNSNLGGFSSDLGTNSVGPSYITGYKDVVAGGTITESYLSVFSAADMVIPQKP